MDFLSVGLFWDRLADGVFDRRMGTDGSGSGNGFIPLSPILCQPRAAPGFEIVSERTARPDAQRYGRAFVTSGFQCLIQLFRRAVGKGNLPKSQQVFQL